MLCDRCVQSHSTHCIFCGHDLIGLVTSHCSLETLRLQLWDITQQLCDRHKTLWNVAEALILSHCLVACATQLIHNLCDRCIAVRGFGVRLRTLDTKEGHYVQTHSTRYPQSWLCEFQNCTYFVCTGTTILPCLKIGEDVTGVKTKPNMRAVPSISKQLTKFKSLIHLVRSWWLFVIKTLEESPQNNIT